MQAWDVILACRNQLHLSSAGGVAGLNLAAAVTVISSRGYDAGTVFELVQDAEGDIVAAINSNKKEH